MAAAGEIPTLSSRGVLGHLRELRRDPLALLDRFNQECGEIGRLRFPGASLLVLNSPALVAELLVDKARSLRKSRILRSALYPLVGDGLFTSDGDLWRRQRRLMAPLFQPAHLGEYAACMVDSAERCIDTWADGSEIDVSREMTRITMAIAGKSLFDADTFDESDDLGEALTVALEWAAEEAASLGLAVQVELAGALDRFWPRAAAAVERPILWPSGRNRRFKKALAVLDRRVARMIADRRADQGPRNDLLTRLLHAHDQTTAGEDSAEAGAGAMSDRQLRDEILTLFVAGHETTATGLSWALYLLARHPAVLEEAAREAAAHPRPERDLGRRAVPDLPLCTQVFKEALRLYPPVPVLERQTLEPISLAGHDLGRGAFVAVFPWALHHRAELWPEPDGFRPERFAPAAEAARDRHSYVPFGVGPRVCLGNHFALLEGPLVLASVLRRVELVRDDPGEIRSGSAGRDAAAARRRAHARAAADVGRCGRRVQPLSLRPRSVRLAGWEIGSRRRSRWRSRRGARRREVPAAAGCSRRWPSSHGWAAPAVASATTSRATAAARPRAWRPAPAATARATPVSSTARAAAMTRWCVRRAGPVG